MISDFWSLSKDFYARLFKVFMKRTAHVISDLLILTEKLLFRS